MMLSQVLTKLIIHDYISISLTFLGYEPIASSCHHDAENSVSIIREEFLSI
jgi:hypothetical protein